MLDQDAKFIITYITREGIAESLNECHEACTGKPAGLTPNDSRLTDEICQEVANKLSETEDEDGEPTDWREKWIATLVKLGFDLTRDPSQPHTTLWLP